MDDTVKHGLRIALLIVRMGHHKRLAALKSRESYMNSAVVATAEACGVRDLKSALRLRVAELLAVVMICDRRRVEDLEEQDTRHKLDTLAAYARSRG